MTDYARYERTVPYVYLRAEYRLMLREDNGSTFNRQWVVKWAWWMTNVGQLTVKNGAVEQETGRLQHL